MYHRMTVTPFCRLIPRSLVAGIRCGAIGAVAVGVLLTACSSPAPESEQTSSGAETVVITAEPASFDADDVAFANNVAANYRQTVQLAGLTQARSANPSVTAFAEAHTAALQASANGLSALSLQWAQDAGENPVSDATQLAAIDDAGMARIESLSGTEFDQLWLQLMLDLSTRMVALADTEMANGTNQDAKTIAQQIKTTQQGAIDQINQIRNPSGNG